MPQLGLPSHNLKMSRTAPATCGCFSFFFNYTATTEIYTLSLHDALPICVGSKSDPDGSAHCSKVKLIRPGRNQDGGCLERWGEILVRRRRYLRRRGRSTLLPRRGFGGRLRGNRTAAVADVGESQRVVTELDLHRSIALIHANRGHRALPLLGYDDWRKLRDQGVRAGQIGVRSGGAFDEEGRERDGVELAKSRKHVRRIGTGLGNKQRIAVAREARSDLIEIL